MTAKKKATAAVLAELGLEPNVSPAKKNEPVAPTAFLPDAPPPARKEPLLSAREHVSVQSVRAADRPGVLRLSLRPARTKSYLPEKVALLPNLGRLEVYDPDEERLRRLLVTVAELAHLRWLELRGATAPPSELGALHHLRELELRDQPNVHNRDLARLPDAFAELRALESLTLWGGTLRELPPSIAKLSSLRDLRLLDLPFVDLPDAVPRLSSLQALSVRADTLDAARALAMLGASRSLRSLHVTSKRMADVVTLGHLTHLVSLGLAGGLPALPSDVATLPGLRFLYVNFNPLERLPETLASAPALLTLSVHGNPKLDIEQTVDVALRSSSLRGLCLPNAGPSPADEKRLRAAGFRRARSMAGDQWFRGELLPSWRSMGQNT